MSAPCPWTCSTKDSHEQTIRNRHRGVVRHRTRIGALCAQEGFDLLVAADRPEIQAAADRANAGHGLGHAFLEQDFADVRHVIDTNVMARSIWCNWSVGRCATEGRDAFY
jgi:hypothetical protein